MIQINRRIRTVLFVAGIIGLFAACNSNFKVRVENPTPTHTFTPPQVVVMIHTLSPTPVPTQMILSTATVTPNGDPSNYYGGFLVTMDYVGQTIAMQKGQSFLLSLTDFYVWQVDIIPAEVLSKNQKITPAKGEQGVFIARKAGKTTLKAVGKPICRDATPACERPDILFTLHVVVN